MGTLMTQATGGQGQLALIPPPEQAAAPKGRRRPRKPQSNLVHLAGGAERLIAARQARDDGRQQLGYSPRDFVYFGLPYKAVKSGNYVRRNGKLMLEVVASPKHGVPYAQDRLLPIWLATAYRLCGKPEDGVIRFRAIRDIIDAFTLPDARGTYPEVGGTDYARLRERLLRLTKCLFVIEELPENPRASNSQRTRLRSYRIIESFDVWFPGQGVHPNDAQMTLWHNFITLDPNWARELREVDVPIDFGAVRALKTQMTALDLYAWQAHRSYELLLKGQKQSVVPVFGEAGLIAQIGMSMTRDRDKRAALRRAQRLITALWRDCPNRFVDNEERFILRPGRALHDNAKLTLPGWERGSGPPRRHFDNSTLERRAAGARRLHVRGDSE